MKYLFTSLITFLSLSAFATTGTAQNVELTALGSTAFAVDEPSLTASYTQSSLALTFTAFSASSVPATNYLAGALSGGSVDWSIYTASPYTGFAVNMSISGTNPDTSFTLDLYDSTFAIIDSFSGFTTGVGGTLQLVELTSIGGGTGNFSDVIGLGFTFDGTLASPNTVTVGSFYAVVPEPSTYALLAMSAAAFGGYVIRRRRRA